jgi:SAM-dependent methyltransferase
MDPKLLTTFATVERTHWWFTARRDILLSVIERFVPAGGAILDVGCGTGYFIESASPRYEAWGVDPSPKAVALCRERGLEHVVQGSAYDLGAVNGRRFNGVLFLDVLEHLDDDARALKEAVRVLRPGGVVIATVPAFMWLWSGHDVVNHHKRRYRLRQIEALFREAGLAIERLTYFNFYLFPLASMDRLVSRVTGRRAAAELRVPPKLVNRLMADTFRLERERVADRSRVPYPFGLSILAVGRRTAA